MKDSTLTQLPELAQFEDFFDARFARVAYHEKSGIIICELKSEYVPIEHFKDRKSTRLNSSHSQQSRMPSSA